MTAQRWWDAAMVTVSVVLSALVLLLNHPIGSNELGVLVVAGVVLVAYFSWGRRYLDGRGSLPGLLYAGVLLVSLAIGISYDPNYAFMQVVVFPTLWVISRSRRQEVALNVLAIVPVTIGYGLYFGPAGCAAGFGVGILSVAFSLALGAWISGVERAGAERSRLLDELLAVQDQLAAANRDAGIDSERGRLAREIHDTIAQSLTGLVMVAQRAHADLEQATDATHGSAALARATADVELIEHMGRDALTEARGLVAAISPVRVESTLAEALGRLAERFERETGVVVHTDMAALGASGATPGDSAAAPLGQELEVVLLRCAQEALANVRKHARAGAATVAITRTAHEVMLTVSDDGVGPADAHTRPSASGFGLAGMADRVMLVGGTVLLSAEEPRGTRLTVTVPHAEHVDTERVHSETERYESVHPESVHSESARSESVHSESAHSETAHLDRQPRNETPA